MTVHIFPLFYQCSTKTRLSLPFSPQVIKYNSSRLLYYQKEETRENSSQGRWRSLNEKRPRKKETRPTFAGNAANDHSQLNAEATVYLEGTSNREKDGDFML